MSSILLAPHGDDETLFAAYTCMRERPHVIVCTYDRDHAVREERQREVAAAVRILDCTHQVWQMSETAFDRGVAKKYLEVWMSDRVPMIPDKVYAPAIEEGGHEQHNIVGELALEVFGERVVPYLTYAPRGHRSTAGQEVVPTAEEMRSKLQALACYRTQIANPATRPWFFELLDMREWLA